MEILMNAMRRADRKSPAYHHMLRMIANLTTLATNRDRLAPYKDIFSNIMLQTTPMGKGESPSRTELCWLLFIVKNLSLCGDDSDEPQVMVEEGHGDDAEEDDEEDEAKFRSKVYDDI